MHRFLQDKSVITAIPLGWSLWFCSAFYRLASLGIFCADKDLNSRMWARFFMLYWILIRFWAWGLMIRSSQDPIIRYFIVTFVKRPPYFRVNSLSIFVLSFILWFVSWLLGRWDVSLDVHFCIFFYGAHLICALTKMYPQSCGDDLLLSGAFNRGGESSLYLAQEKSVFHNLFFNFFTPSRRLLDFHEWNFTIMDSYTNTYIA